MIHACLLKWPCSYSFPLCLVTGCWIEFSVVYSRNGSFIQRMAFQAWDCRRDSVSAHLWVLSAAPPTPKQEGDGSVGLSPLSWVVKEMPVLLWGPYYHPGGPALLADHGPPWVVGGGPERTEVRRFTRLHHLLRYCACCRWGQTRPCLPKALDSAATDIRGPPHHELGRWGLASPLHLQLVIFPLHVTWWSHLDWWANSPRTACSRGKKKSITWAIYLSIL